MSSEVAEQDRSLVETAGELQAAVVEEAAAAVVGGSLISWL